MKLFTEKSPCLRVAAAGISGLILFGLIVAATPKPAKKPSVADRKVLAKTYLVQCDECEPVSRYRLKPIRVVRNGSRSSDGGDWHAITLYFRCPDKHEIEAEGQEQFVPKIKAEEVK